jgi:hypothetical protein
MPGLKAAGWDKRQIREQYRITNGKIIASVRRHRPGNPLVADYVLEYRDDVPLAVVEAKRTKVDAAAGIEQAKRYAQRLELPWRTRPTGTRSGRSRPEERSADAPISLPRMSCGRGFVTAKAWSRSGEEDAARSLRLVAARLQPGAQAPPLLPAHRGQSRPAGHRPRAAPHPADPRDGHGQDHGGPPAGGEAQEIGLDGGPHAPCALSTSTGWRCTSGTTCPTSWSRTAGRCGSWGTASSCATWCCP